MSKAEERALERFPVHEGASEEWIKVHLKGICGDYIEGYHQAEKDLALTWEKALTWEDIRLIAEIGDKFMNSEESDNLSEEEYYTEILNRFKAQKGEKV